MIRRCEKRTKKHQKTKCHIGFVRYCLMYNLTPKFVKFKMAQRTRHSNQLIIQLQRNHLQHEFNQHLKLSKKMEREIEPIWKNLEAKVNIYDYMKI